MVDHKLIPRSPTLEMLAYWREERVSAEVGMADLEAVRSWHGFWDAFAANAVCLDQLVSDIDVVLAAIVDLTPLTDYGLPGSHDTVQARRRHAISRAQESLLSLRRVLAPTPATPAVPARPLPSTDNSPLTGEQI